MEHPKVKVNASQAISIHKHKNLRLKLLKYNANIYFNKQCLSQKVIPTYAKLRIPYTSPASLTTQLKIQIIRIKDEIIFLYQKKKHLNKELYKIHLQATAEWGTVWDLIHSSIIESTQTLIDEKYKTIKLKIEKNCCAGLNPFPVLLYMYVQWDGTPRSVNII
jgi:hypothetical protein